jgi:hypothetical protein
VSGNLGRSLSVTASGGSIRIGEPAELLDGVADGGIEAGGAIGSVAARTMKGRDGAKAYAIGGVVGFVPDALMSGTTPAVATLEQGPWMRVASGVASLKADDARNYDIGTVSGDLGVFGVFTAADDESSTTGPVPLASVRRVQTKLKAPKWAGAAAPWWFRAAGWGYSRNSISVKAGNDDDFHDARHP